jgi:predicted DNA-binding transcriptional regulator AlpA
MNQKHSTALTGFDCLPDAAGVRLPVVKALFGVSAPTVWRWSRKSIIPAPTKRGGVALWNVGELRKVLQA